jgi:hypothetical protein
MRQKRRKKMVMGQVGKTELLSSYFISVPAALGIESLRNNMLLGALCFSGVRYSYLVFRDNSINKVTGYELDNQDSIFIIDSNCASSMSYPGPSLFPRCIVSTEYSGIKQPEDRAQHLSTSSADVENVWKFISTLSNI